MKILFVINNYYVNGNGMSTSARRTVGRLRAAGHEVRVLSGRGDRPEERPDYELPDLSIPLFNNIIAYSGFRYARIKRSVIKEAVEWAELVHFEEAFLLERYVVRVALKMGRACTTTYHLHPENIFYTLHLGRCRLVNDALLRFWRNTFYNKCSDIHCPSENVRERLEKKHFKSRLHVISNGVLPDTNIRATLPARRPEEPFRLICIGRLSREKDQYTLLEAMKCSRHASHIQLVFAGQGPAAPAIKRCARRLFHKGTLAYEPSFKFYDAAGLREATAGADLYIHCAVVEVEGLSALEAMRQGVVPVIASGPLTATAQFALTPESTFPIRDARALASRIDWWLDRPELMRETGARYAESVSAYDMDNCVEQLSSMFALAASGKSA